MKIADIVLLLFISILVTMVFGYGWVLCVEPFLKWCCVLAWAGIIGAISFVVREAVEKH